MSTITSKDGTALQLYHWPCAHPRAQVVLVHGFGEHAQRYDEVAGGLVAAGFDVVGGDLRGHGKSAGVRGYIDSFSEYGDDLDAILAEGARLAPALPRFVVGHSLGGLISLIHVLDRRPKLAGLVLSSPFLRVKLQVPEWKVLAAKVASRLYPKLSLPAGLTGKDVARDPEIAARYDSDRLNLKNATARWYTETMAAQDRIFSQAGELDLPVLLLHGEADAVADPRRSAELFGRLGSKDKTLELLTGAYHEIFNELPTERRRIVGRVAQWLDRHLEGESTAAHTL